MSYVTALLKILGCRLELPTPEDNVNYSEAHIKDFRECMLTLKLPWKPRKVMLLVLLPVLLLIVAVLPLVFWWSDSIAAQNPSGPLRPKYYTVESGGGGPADTV